MSPEKHAIRDLEKWLSHHETTPEISAAVVRVLMAIHQIIYNPNEPQASVARGTFISELNTLETLAPNALWLDSTRALLKEPT